MKHFEVAENDDPVGLIKASQKALISTMRKLIFEIKEENTKQPGLTWEQLDFFLNEFEKKEPKIIYQEYEL